MCCGKRGMILLSCRTCQYCASEERKRLTISTLPMAEVISSQQPQFMGKRCTLRRNQDKASSVFFSFAKTMP